MKTRELKGFKSLRAMNVFHTLMLGLKMLPMHLAEPYEEFYARIKSLPEEQQKAMISKAALFVTLEEPEVEAIAYFCEDANGVPYNSASLKKLGPDKIHEMIVAVCFEISKIQIDMISDAEKKNSKISQ